MKHLSPYTSTPRTEFRGVKDGTTEAIPVATQSVAIVNPLMISLAPWGETDEIRKVDKGLLTRLYGAEVIDPTSVYYTHQSRFLETTFEGGAEAFFQRVVHEDATKGTMRFDMDIVEDEIPRYERNADGSFKLDPEGLKIPTGDTVLGHRIQIRKRAIPVVDNASTFGVGAISQGNMTAVVDGATSELVPFFDGEARFVGAKGGNLGVRLSAPTTGNQIPADLEMFYDMETFLFRIQQMERSTPRSTPQVVPTVDGRRELGVSFERNAFHESTRTEYAMDKTLIGAFEGQTPDTFAGWGHFSRIHVYHDLLQTKLQAIADAENAVTGGDLKAAMVNFLTGVSPEGIPYETVVVEGPEKGGLLMTELTTHYFEEASDGGVGPTVYNELMADLFDNVENSEIAYYDIARYPFSSVWDSGFPLETKLKMGVFHDIRPEIGVFTCTQDVSMPINTPAVDSSVAITLKNIIRQRIESTEFGTAGFRGFLQANAGYVIGSEYQGLVPFLESTLLKMCQYGGAANGKLNPAFSFGRGEENVITRYRNHNATSRKLTVKNQDWNNGMVYAEYYDIDRTFVAGYQTVHVNQNSALNSLLNMMILNNVTRVGHEVWRRYTGDSKLTDDQFRDAVEQAVVDATEDAYDSRADIRPELTRTKLDDALGFSWHLTIHVGLDNGRTLQHLAVFADRRRGE